ncbi:hypothetical protein J7J47_07320 [Halomonas sp. ISL-60]|nr:hypothetical protein [Halomonas sp. ISL-60]
MSTSPVESQCQDSDECLIEKRKYLTHSLLLENGVDPDEGLEDDELLLMLIDNLSTPQVGRLAPYTPVVVNVLRQWITV